MRTSCQLETSKSSAFWDMGVDSHLKWLLLFSPDEEGGSGRHQSNNGKVGMVLGLIRSKFRMHPKPNTLYPVCPCGPLPLGTPALGDPCPWGPLPFGTPAFGSPAFGHPQQGYRVGVRDWRVGGRDRILTSLLKSVSVAISSHWQRGLLDRTTSPTPTQLWNNPLQTLGCVCRGGGGTLSLEF